MNIVYLQMAAPEWTSISQSAKDLVLGMLNPKPNKRLSIHEVLNHPWLRVSCLHHSQVKLPWFRSCVVVKRKEFNSITCTQFKLCHKNQSTFSRGCAHFET